MQPKLTALPPFPANSNPFHHDMSNMGTRMGKDLMLMHRNHDTEECKYLILVNTATGERWRLDLVAPTAEQLSYEALAQAACGGKAIHAPGT
jgi:hypothetical protein